MAQKGSEFHVKLDGIKLSGESEKRIEASIQAAVMNELAGFKPNPDDPTGSSTHLKNPIIIIKPHPWPGLIAKKILPNDLNNIAGFNKLSESPGF
jgi:hypothetical protein